MEIGVREIDPDEEEDLGQTTRNMKIIGHGGYQSSQPEIGTLRINVFGTH
jgi:hypothetical protein